MGEDDKREADYDNTNPQEKKGPCFCKSYATELKESGLQGPRDHASRHCTDPLSFLLFVSYALGMVVIGILAAGQGNADRLIMGSDSFGNICGKDNTNTFMNVSNSGLDMTGLDYVYYLDPAAYATLDSPAMCVKECPGNDGGMGNVSAAACALCGVSDTEETCALCRQYSLCFSNSSTYSDDVPTQNSWFSSSYISGNDNCPIYVYKSKPIATRCIPSLDSGVSEIIASIQAAAGAEDSSLTTGFADVLNGDVTSYLQDLWDDFYEARLSLFYLLIIGFAVSILMVIMMRFFVRIFVYLVILLVHVALIGISVLLWYDYLDRRSTINDARSDVNSTEIVSDQQVWTRDFMLTLAIIASVVTLILLLITIAMRKSIQIAIAVFEESSKALAASPILFLTPVSTFGAVLGASVLWLWVGLYIVTWDVAEVNNSTGYVEYKYSTTSYGDDSVPSEQETEFIWLYYVFGLLWGLQFIIASGSMIVSGSIVSWYFNGPHNEKGHHEHSRGCFGSIWTFVRYHMGTVALGSLVIAIIQMIRAILAYIQKKYKNQVGRVGRFVLCCCQCCLWLLEKCMKYINKNAYAITAIHGYHFWSAACTAFGNIFHNLMLVAAVNGVGYLVLSLIKILTVCINLFFTYLMFNKDEASKDAMWYLMVLVALFTWCIIDGFTDLYSTAIDTILMAYLEDQKHNDGTQQKPYHAGSGLQSFLHNQAKALNTEIKDVNGNKANMHSSSPSGQKVVQVSAI